MSKGEKRMLFVDPSGTFHCIDQDYHYHWSKKTNVPACKHHKDGNQNQIVLEFQESLVIREQIPFVDCKYPDLHTAKGVITVDSFVSLGMRVPLENVLTQNARDFWIRMDTGEVYSERSSCPTEHHDRLLHIYRNDFKLTNKDLNIVFEFSIFEATNMKDSVEIIHVRSFPRLYLILEGLGIPLDEVILEEFVVLHDSRFRLDNGGIAYQGRWFKHNEEAKRVLLDVIVLEAPRRYPEMICYYMHVGSDFDLLVFHGHFELQNVHYLAFESFVDLKSYDKLLAKKDVVKSIVGAAFHIYKKERIHGNLKMSSLVVTPEGHLNFFGMSEFNVDKKSKNWGVKVNKEL